MRFLEGLDDIGLTLRNADAITTYEASRKSWLAEGRLGPRPCRRRR